MSLLDVVRMANDPTFRSQAELERDRVNNNNLFGFTGTQPKLVNRMGRPPSVIPGLEGIGLMGASPNGTDEANMVAIKQMLTNPNPEMRAQGQALLANQIAARNALAKPINNDIEEKVRSVGLDPLTPEGQAFAREYLMKSGGTTIINSAASDEFGKLETGYRWKDPLNKALGVEPTPGGSAAQTGKVMSEYVTTAMSQGDLLGEMANLYEEGVDVSGYIGLIEKARGQDNWLAPALNAAMNYAGEGSNQAAVQQIALASNVQNNIVRLLSGAAVTVQESERIKSQLPIPGQSKEVFKNNLRLTHRNTIDLLRRINKMNPNVPMDEAALEIPNKLRRRGEEWIGKNGTKYRIGPDGDLEEEVIEEE